MRNVYFDQCVDFIARMIEKYADEILLFEKDTEQGNDLESDLDSTQMH